MSNTKSDLQANLEVKGNITPEFENILTPEAFVFLAELHKKFDARRHELLEKRNQRQAEIDKGNMPTFLEETKHIREDKNWKVAPIPKDLQDRRVEITGPVERKMMINALNSGANIFMADFEDSNSPTWENAVQGQINSYDAIRKTITFHDAKKNKDYKLNEETAVLLVRPRGWHLNEKNLLIDGKPISGGLFDFGLYMFHNAKELVKRGSGPYFYLPKIESHLEARLWNEAFVFAQNYLDIPQGTIKATVLLETIMASFEIEEILYELKDHMAGINAGRWDYIFSAIKKFRNVVKNPLPDRGEITMTVPFMKAYTELLVRGCHTRGAHAIGGMSAFIPTRHDEEINKQAFEKVRKDKEREANDGFDGSWVAHPDLVKVAKDVFDAKFGDKPNQKDRLREDVDVEEMVKELTNFDIEGGKITDAGVRMNFNVGIRYIASWLDGVGAAAIFNLMEDAATAEISRTQLWQWLNNPNAKLADGTEITEEYLRKCMEEEYQSIKNEAAQYPNFDFENSKFPKAKELMEGLVFTKEYKDFLTTEAYHLI
ncbi:malate synthase A [Bernardetia sp. ABR2-2B]|uniref:malate synthase A n=1 Tax=Bernardetia sp. ABR2-2B TaxID=3127472 RepID=UPI0030D4F232